MPRFDHTIVPARDKNASARFLARILGLNGGPGVYFRDPNGHLLEILTRKRDPEVG